MRHAMAQSKNVRRHEAPGTSRLLRAKMFGDKKIRAQAHLECRRAKTFGDKLLTGASPLERSKPLGDRPRPPKLQRRWSSSTVAKVEMLPGVNLAWKGISINF